ncbi:hypothetical protein ACC676_01135 [Rhizobium ruizarguesonis]
MSIASLMFDPISFEELMGSEFFRAAITLHGEDTNWFRHLLTDDEQREFIAGGVYPVYSSTPRVFSTIDSLRRHAVFLDARYLHYQTCFLRYFATDLAEIANMTVGTSGLLTLPDLSNHRAVRRIQGLGYFYTAEVATAPALKLPFLTDTVLDICLSPEAGFHEAAGVLDDLKFELEDWTAGQLGEMDKALVRIIAYHELAHIKLNGFASTKMAGRRLVSQFIRFQKAELDAFHRPDDRDGYSPEFQKELLRHSAGNDGTLEEICADNLAARLLVASCDLEHMNIDAAKDLILVQACAIVASTFFGSLLAKVEKGARRSNRPQDLREISEPFARFNMAIWNVALSLRRHCPIFQDPQQVDEIKRFVVGVANAVRAVELHVRPIELRVQALIQEYVQNLKKQKDAGRPDSTVMAHLALRSLERLGWPIEDILAKLGLANGDETTETAGRP